MFPLKLNGLALATSISASFNFFMLFYMLNKKIGGLDGWRIFRSFVKVLMASLVMVVVIYFGTFKIGINLFLVIFIGIVTYSLFTFIFGVKEAGDFLKWALRRK